MKRSYDRGFEVTRTYREDLPDMNDATDSIQGANVPIQQVGVANFRLPLGLDKIIRAVLVTPDMHRVHHSDLRSEHDSNYGFSLSIWDRMFGTYVAQPQKGHDEMTIGLQWQDDAPSKLGWSLTLPFRNK